MPVPMEPTPVVAAMWPGMAEAMRDRSCCYGRVCAMSGGLEGSFEAV
ncbi:MAG: hypothetical protein Q8P61_04995 [Candidatus Nanopelagicales bacterium]|nr:hypothetical protein [Candidatus Nanopelagicales bacterium]